MKNKILFLSLGFWFMGAVAFAQNPNFNYTQTCYGNQTTLVAFSTLPDTSIASWQWDLDTNGTFDVSGKTIIYLFSQNDTVAVRLRITPKSGAPADTLKNVIIDPLPQVNFISGNLCELKSATYISQSTISSGNISQYKWDFNNDGVDDFTGNDTAYFTCGPASTYLTKLTCVSDKGCSAFTQKVTTVYPNPDASFTTSNFCLNDSAVFTNTSTITNLDFYLWDFGDGNQAATFGNATHLYSAVGPYMIKLVAVTQNGCRDTSSLTTNILPIPSVFFSGNLAICIGGNTVLTASGGVGYSWFTGETTNNITVAPTSATSYSVFVVNGNGCTNTASATVDVNPLPLVSITASSTVLSSGGNVTMIANGANNYVWNTGANSISISTDTAGIFSVTGSDVNGCSASSSITILNENIDSVSVSGNILTPNGDGFNDAFVIDNISAYSTCDLKIYNSWNDEVFSVSGYKNDWKGTNTSGNLLPTGAYYYIIKCDDKPVLKGNINILREK